MSQQSTRRELLHGVGRLTLSAAGLVLLNGCAVSPGRGPSSAPAEHVATIGYLGGIFDEQDADEDSWLPDVREGLRELGWVEGGNMRSEVRTAQGGPASLPALAAELVGIPVDAIVTQGRPSVRAAASETSLVPIVMVNGPPDPIESGLAASIQRPGGNVTGNVRPPDEIFGKRLEQLVEAVPHVSRVAYLGSRAPSVVESLRGTAQALGVQLQVLPPGQGLLELTFAAIDQEAADALLVDATVGTISQRARILDFATRRRLPAMYETRPFAVAGGLMSYDVNRAAVGRRAATYVDRILRGAKPGELPIEYPTQYDLIINLKTAESLSLTIPDVVLAQAVEVIR